MSNFGIKKWLPFAVYAVTFFIYEAFLLKATVSNLSNLTGFLTFLLVPLFYWGGFVSIISTVLGWVSNYTPRDYFSLYGFMLIYSTLIQINLAQGEGFWNGLIFWLGLLAICGIISSLVIAILFLIKRKT